MKISLKFLRQAFEKSREAIAVTDAEANIIHVNPAFTDITGYVPDEVLGKKSSFMTSDVHDDEFFETIWETLKKEGEWVGEIYDCRKNGEVYPKSASIYAVQDEEGAVSHYIHHFSDITKLKKYEQDLKSVLNFDPVTGLPNRLLFKEHFQIALSIAERKKQLASLLILDIDRFKMINDMMGHHVGDQILKKVGERLAESVRGSDFVGNLGGDEFAIVLSHIEQLENSALVAQKIMDSFEAPFLIDESEISLNISIGITLFPIDGTDRNELLKNADFALIKAKEESGISSYAFYTSVMQENLKKRQEIEQDLQRAIQRNEFFLVYQPKVDAQTGVINDMESLIRWEHPEKGIISPIFFIPVAEETEFIIPLGKWVLQESCRQIHQWHTEGFQDLKISINIAAVQLTKSDFLADLKEVLEETGVNPQSLELELTERVIVDNVEENVKILHAIRELGVAITIDDFGTGYSSLSYLKRFPIDCIKIDKSFVDDIPQDSGSNAIASAIISLAHSLNMYVVAEGVETKEQLDFLRGESCDQIQGYYFSKPIRAQEFGELLKKQPMFPLD